MIDPREIAAGRVVVQGGTGRIGRAHLARMRAFGTNIVGVVSPTSAEREVDGVPVFAGCAAAVEGAGATATVAFVPAAGLRDAIAEAVAAGIRHVVTPTEGMPAHDALRALSAVRAAGAHWVGASTPGLAVPGSGKLGFLPDLSLAPGRVGIASKSGTLSYEVGYRLVRAGLGQSAWVGVGGDPVKGTRFSDLIDFFDADAATRAVVLIGEIGGTEEEDFAEAVRRRRFAKPVFAVIAGATAPQGVTMGHAGAMIHGEAGTYASKRKALESVGATVFASLSQLDAGLAAIRSAAG